MVTGGNYLIIELEFLVLTFGTHLSGFGSLGAVYLYLILGGWWFYTLTLRLDGRFAGQSLAFYTCCTAGFILYILTCYIFQMSGCLHLYSYMWSRLY